MWRVDYIYTLIFNHVGGSASLTLILYRGQLYYFFCHISIFLQSLPSLVHFLSLQVVVIIIFLNLILLRLYRCYLQEGSVCWGFTLLGFNFNGFTLSKAQHQIWCM